MRGIGPWTASAAAADFTGAFSVYPHGGLAVRTWARKAAPGPGFPDREPEFEAVFVNAPLRDYVLRPRANDPTLPVLGLACPLDTGAPVPVVPGVEPQAPARRGSGSRGRRRPPPPNRSAGGATSAHARSATAAPAGPPHGPPTNPRDPHHVTAPLVRAANRDGCAVKTVLRRSTIRLAGDARTSLFVGLDQKLADDAANPVPRTPGRNSLAALRARFGPADAPKGRQTRRGPTGRSRSGRGTRRSESRRGLSDR